MTTRKIKLDKTGAFSTVDGFYTQADLIVMFEVNEEVALLNKIRNGELPLDTKAIDTEESLLAIAFATGSFGLASELIGEGLDVYDKNVKGAPAFFSLLCTRSNLHYLINYPVDLIEKYEVKGKHCGRKGASTAISYLEYHQCPPNLIDFARRCKYQRNSVISAVNDAAHCKHRRPKGL